MRIRNRCTDPKMRLGCDGWSDVPNERAYNPFANTTTSAKRLMVWVNRCTGVSSEGNLLACRATCDNPLRFFTNSGNVPVAAPDGVYAVSRADSNTYVPSLMVPSGATCTVTDRTVVTLEEAPIVMLMDCLCFAADTAPYAIPVGGGVLLLALVVLIGGWPHENTESMAGPALRKQGQHLEFDTGICHHSEERRPLGIHHTQWRILHSGAEVRMHDDAAQPAQFMGLHTAGDGGYAAHGEWGLRHGHHQRRSKEYCWHLCDCRYQDHGDGHVRRRSERMADPAGGGSARLRSRHRPLLSGLGVAA